jgi:hypothetical protein
VLDRRTQTKFLLTFLAGLVTGALARLVVRHVKEEDR